MNFLELCQDLASEASISGTIVSVAGQVGEQQRAVNWVAKAYKSIQNKHEGWTFLRGDVGFDTVAATDTYSAAQATAGGAEFGEWLFASGWRCYGAALGVADEQPVRFLDYDNFRSKYMYGSNRLVTGRPQVVTERPDQSLQFWPTPDGIYTIVGEQHRAPHRMTLNTDLPIFPAKFHDAIVYRALMLYAEYEGDATVFASAQTEFARVLDKMESLYLPQWESSEPMA